MVMFGDLNLYSFSMTTLYLENKNQNTLWPAQRHMGSPQQ